MEPILARLGEKPTPQQILDLKVCDPAVGSGAFLVEACRQLGDALVAAWAAHGGKPVIPPDEDELLHARRLVAQRCLYGVDRNPMATDLAKLSLWLATLAKDHPFTFLDHSLRTGDALVGLSKKHIIAFHWDLEAKEAKERIFGQTELEKALERAMSYRREILEGGDTMLPGLKSERLQRADHAHEPVRRAGDLCLAAFFAGDKPKKRAELREQYLDALLECDPKHGFRPEKIEAVGKLVNQLRNGQPHPVTPFHWEMEFPEVFARENGGFDAFVGNPPFLGGKRITTVSGERYRDWLVTLHSESNSNSDLVAHFFRRAFNLLRRAGTFGLIATNTIRQGDTRQTGLRWICVNGDSTIYAARRRYKWPGVAAVTVSVVWIAKGKLPAPFDLDGQPSPIITAFLFHDGGHENPAVLEANGGKSFIGMFLRGMGFTFDDTDKKGVAGRLEEMNHLVETDPSNTSRIFPFLGGEEVNDSPTHSHHRYAISFEEFPLYRDLSDETWDNASEDDRAEWLKAGIVPNDYPNPVAADWPDLLRPVELRVKPERLKLGDSSVDRSHKTYWWRYGNSRPELRSILNQRDYVIVNSQVSSYVVFARVPAAQVFGHTLNIFPTDHFGFFALLQSRAHDGWARFFASSMKDDLRYTPTDCFETFPFPPDWETNEALEKAGKEYYDFRADLMVRHNEGLTKTYNRFHHREETDPGILRLRELHAAMDHAVLAAYGWSDLVEQGRTACEFIPDYYDEPAEEGGDPIPKSIRYRWPDATRDEVLARLLKLNAERHAEEVRQGLHTPAAKKAARKRTAKKTAKKTARRVPAPEVPDEGHIVPFPTSPPELFPEFVPQPELPAAAASKPYTQGFARQVLAAEILWQCRDEPTMGRVKLQKLIHLCEYHAQISELDSQYNRAAAGPFDASLMIGIHNGLAKQGWFEAVKTEKGTKYRPLAKAGEHQQRLAKWSDRLPAIQHVIDIFKDKKTQSCEIASTLYAAWNDLLIEGNTNPTDAQILAQASKDHWHAKKEEISRETWAKGLARLKELDLIPKGWGNHTKRR